MVDQRKPHVCHLQWNDIHNTCQRQRDLPPTRAVMQQWETVSILQCYFHVKHNQTYIQIMQFLEFKPWQKCPSVTGEHVFVLCDRCN